MRISDWSSDVCSSDLELTLLEKVAGAREAALMAELIISDGIGRNDISARRARFEQPRKISRRESSRQYKILSGAESVGYIQEWDSGKVSLERSEERRVGQECVSTGNSRWSRIN